jgi:prepilin-type N-terminal cleavage/methylation domain-containing protein
MGFTMAERAAAETAALRRLRNGLGKAPARGVRAPAGGKTIAGRHPDFASRAPPFELLHPMKTIPQNSVTRHPPAFTIVELLVVIAIIGILAAILLPVLSKAKTAAERSKAKIEISELVTAIMKYDSDYGRFPTSPEDQSLVDSTNDFTCGGAGYDINGINRQWTMGITNNAEVIAILMDATNYPGGGPTPNMLHVKNPRRTIFLSARIAPDTNSPGIGPDGVYRDPWGGPYIITMDLNYDEQCRGSNYCLKAVSQNPPASNSQQGFNGLYNPDRNGDSDNFFCHGKVMVWSAGPDRKIDAPPPIGTSAWGPADRDFNKDNILSWQ